MPAESSLLIDRLFDPGAYPHAVRDFEVRETHISWVILTGEYAYKIKKPVRFDFLDFSTLERRAHFCREELRLNRRYAPELYVDVVPITGSTRTPRIGGKGPPIEYAVLMRQFDDRNLVDRCLQEERLSAADVDAMSTTLSRFHAHAEAAPPESRFGRPQLILQEARDNLAALKNALTLPRQRSQLDRLSRWTEQEALRLDGVFGDRRTSGQIRECHGDLHLGNMFLHDGTVTFFDGIEFNEDFRWIDVMSELAFTVMDFMDRGRHDFGNRLLNAYLETCGDYQGLGVMPFYVVYRALVRAKVDALRLGQAGEGQRSGSGLAEELNDYLELADHLTRRSPPQFAITSGVSGSGKTTGTQRLVDEGGMIRVRSDVERKRLFGLAPNEAARAAIGEGIYSDAATRDTYDRLAELAREVILAGYSVLVDATFLQSARRRQFQQLAESLNTPFQIIVFDDEPTELRRRVSSRRAGGNDASDAGLAVLERQLQTREPLCAEEWQFVTDLDAIHATVTGGGSNASTI